jgi:AmmeMemoRadiSam system protein A
MMTALTEKDKAFLVRLARSVIEAELDAGQKEAMPEDVSPAILEKCGCFVTLHKKGALRGCIGTIEPVHPLVKGVQENAINAAFKDPRFSSLKTEELPDIDLEVSVLTAPRKLIFKDSEDLKRQLKPGIHGVILSRGWQQSTFLPQVWDQLPDPELFLRHLCEKAGLQGDCWQDPKIEIEVYEASYFSDQDVSHKL